MKIISKFHDYYDAMMKFGVDPKCVYIRKAAPLARGLEDTVLETDVIADFLENSKRLTGSLGKRLRVRNIYLVVFCGKIYPCFEMEASRRGDPAYCAWTFTWYDYTHPQLMQSVETECTKVEIRRFLNTKRRKWSRNNNTKAYEIAFECSGNTSDALVNLHHRMEVPVFTVLSHGIGHDGRIEVNPRLHDVHFYRAVDSYTAYQELAMFVSGVLGGKSPTTIEVSDDIKIAKRGFDKWSFRKEPEK